MSFTLIPVFILKIRLPAQLTKQQTKARTLLSLSWKATLTTAVSRATGHWRNNNTYIFCSAVPHRVSSTGLHLTFSNIKTPSWFTHCSYVLLYSLDFSQPLRLPPEELPGATTLKTKTRHTHLTRPKQDVIFYYWREMPEGSFLLRQTRVCRDKTCLWSRRKYACHHKTFVATNIFFG